MTKMTGILVTYATEHGSTRQVAEAIAVVLRRDGLGVELRAARDVRGPVYGFGLVVLGAPLYSGRWHRDAHWFLEQHRSELGQVRVAVFGMGPRSDNPESWRRSRSQLNRALSRRGWLTPAAVAVFGGVDPGERRRRQPVRDLRDWTAIRSWAEALPALALVGAAR